MTAHRMTKQKKLILDIVKGTTCHPTADWVYQEARKMLPNISLGTVYRNLRLLVAMGEIMELNYASSFSRFDGNPENHYHFTCTGCGQVFDLDMSKQLDWDNVIDKEEYLVQSHRLEFYGLCRDCK